MNIAQQSLNQNCMQYRMTDTDVAYVADVSDIHVGNLYHNREAFETFIEKVKAIPKMRLIIGGDSTDNSYTQSASSVFEQGLDGGDQIIALRDILKPIRDQILFVRSGNHGYERALRFNKLIPEQMLAELLGLPFFHGMASVFFNVDDNCYVLGTWHNAKRPTAMEWLHTDVTFYEHLHKTNFEESVVFKPNRFTKSWTADTHYDVQSGSWLGWGGYSADKGYRPQKCSTNIIQLSGGGSKKRNIRVFSDIDHVLEFELMKGQLANG